MLTKAQRIKNRTENARKVKLENHTIEVMQKKRKHQIESMGCKLLSFLEEKCFFPVVEAIKIRVVFGIYFFWCKYVWENELPDENTP